MIPGDLFFDRRDEILSLLELFSRVPDYPVQSCVLLGPRRVGTSEMIKRVFKELFLNQDRILPFYYRFERLYSDPLRFAQEYLSSMIHQYMAFREKDPSLLGSRMTSFQSTKKMAEGHSDSVLHRLMEEYEEAVEDPDRTGLVLLALQAPEILAGHSTGCAGVLLDHFHLIFRMRWPNCRPLFELFPGVMESRKAPHLFTGLSGILERDYLGTESMAGQVRRMSLRGMNSEKALITFLGLCERYRVEADREIVKEEIDRFHGIPFYMLCVVRRAQHERITLTRPGVLRDLYFQEISSGEIAFYFDTIFNHCCNGPFTKRDAIRILTLAPLKEGRTLRIEEVAKRVFMDLSRVRGIIAGLDASGLLRENYGMVVRSDDPVLADFLRVAHDFWLRGADMNSIRKGVFQESRDIPILTGLKKVNGGGPERDEGQRVSFGLVLPMVSETELVAARALEQVAERADFPDEEIGKIRMALIEACINSFEHSGSEDGKIYITFILDHEKLTVIVEDKGCSFDPSKISPPLAGQGDRSPSRRGWGLALIRNLVDEAVFENARVGTKLRMVKYYPGMRGGRLNVRVG